MKKSENEYLEYDVRMRAQAGTTATFRAVVAAYIIYLGVTLIRGAINGGGSEKFPLWAGWLFGLLFIACGAGFGVYIFKRWRADVEAARLLPPEEEPEETLATETEESRGEEPLTAEAVSEDPRGEENRADGTAPAGSEKGERL